MKVIRKLIGPHKRIVCIDFSVVMQGNAAVMNQRGQHFFFFTGRQNKNIFEVTNTLRGKEEQQILEQFTVCHVIESIKIQISNKIAPDSTFICSVTSLHAASRKTIKHFYNH